MKGPIEVTGAVYQQESMFSHTAIVQSSYLLVANSLLSRLRSWLEITQNQDTLCAQPCTSLQLRLFQAS